MSGCWYITMLMLAFRPELNILVQTHRGASIAVGSVLFGGQVVAASDFGDVGVL